MHLETGPIGDDLNRLVPARLRQELRNPSMLSVLVAMVAVLALPLALLIPGWIATTKNSLELRQAAGAQREAAILSASAVVSSHIVPWMLNQVKQLETADGSGAWHATSFSRGPCDRTNLMNLPAGKYASAISSSCADLQEIQTAFSSDCPSSDSCVVSDAALIRLAATRTELVDAFAGAGFVSDYRSYDERWMR